MQGSGPVLLIIPGGPQDAGVFADISRRLADRYTVVAYDPRGNSRSNFDGAPEEHATRRSGRRCRCPDQGARRRGGLCVRNQRRRPDRARPCGPPSRARACARRARTAEHDAACRPVGGAGRLAGTFTTPIAARASKRQWRSSSPTTAWPRELSRKKRRRNSPRRPKPPRHLTGSAAISNTGSRTASWRCRSTVPTSKHCAPSKPRVVVAIGKESAGQPIEGMGMALAAKLGTKPVMFPGDHMGFAPTPILLPRPCTRR